MRLLRTGSRAAVLTLSLALLIFSPAQGADFPSPQGPVNDFAGVIDPQTKARMESLALEVEQKTGAALVVATFKSLNGRDLETLANELFQAWGIGRKGKDNGLLILIAVQERKLRIETGYGLEGILPDGKLGRIRDQWMVPFFKKGLYGPGLENGLRAIAGEVAREAGVELSGAGQPAQGRPPQEPGFNLLAVLVFALFLATVLLIRRRIKRGRFSAEGPYLPGIIPWLGWSSQSGPSDSGGNSFGGFGGSFGGFGGGMSGGGGVSGSW